jgi:hypothetical protein
MEIAIVVLLLLLILGVTGVAVMVIKKPAASLTGAISESAKPGVNPVLDDAKGDRPAPAPDDESKHAWYRALISGSKRTYGLIALGVAFFVAAAYIPPDGLLGVLMRGLMAIGALCIALAVAHRARTAIAPYLDLKVLADKAAQEPVGAGLMGLGVLYFVAEIISALLQVFVFK